MNLKTSSSLFLGALRAPIRISRTSGRSSAPRGSSECVHSFYNQKRFTSSFPDLPKPVDVQTPAPPPPTPRPSLRAVALSGLGAFFGVGTLSVFHYYGIPNESTMLLGSLGASAVLIFGSPAAPFSQPKSVLVGQSMSAFIGITAAALIPDVALAAPLAVSGALMAMMATNTVHPPAGGTALLAVLGSSQHLGYALMVPVVSGSSVLVLCGVAYNHLIAKNGCPKL